jgi:glycerol-3-phosphate dehydrogenase
MTAPIKDPSDMGRSFGHGLFGFEVDHLIEREWARNGADVLWRRTRLGLLLSAGEALELDTYIKEKISTGKGC